MSSQFIYLEAKMRTVTIIPLGSDNRKIKLRISDGIDRVEVIDSDDNILFNVGDSEVNGSYYEDSVDIYVI